MRIEISYSTFRRLQKHAEARVDTLDTVITKLLDHYEKGPGAKWASRAGAGRSEASYPAHDLRGLQKELWELIILQIPTRDFSLGDVKAREVLLKPLRPNVNDLGASIRGTLQKLREKGYIEFVNNRGSYRRLK